MKSRLITALAIGALTIGLLPGVASAAPNLSCEVDNALNSCGGETLVTITVTEGTTIVVSGGVTLSSAFPGQKVSSDPKTFDYWSNQQNKTIFAILDEDPWRDANTDTIHDVGETTVFDMNNVELNAGDATYVGPAADQWMAFDSVDYGPDSKAVPVEGIEFNGATNESASSGSFALEVHVPQAEEGTYYTTMTYSVDTFDDPWD